MDGSMEYIGWQDFNSYGAPKQPSKQHLVFYDYNGQQPTKTLCGVRIPHPSICDDGSHNSGYCKRCKKIRQHKN